MTDEKTRNVGYMNPPEHTRFNKGTTGNPRGRPRKSEDLNTVLQRVLNRKVGIKDDDRKMPIKEALIRKLRELALDGDKQALALQRRILTEAGCDEPDPDLEFREQQRSIERVAQRFQEMKRVQGDSNEG